MTKLIPGKLYKIVVKDDSFFKNYLSSYSKRFKLEKPVMFLRYLDPDKDFARVLTNNGKLEYVNLITVNLKPFKK